MLAPKYMYEYNYSKFLSNEHLTSVDDVQQFVNVSPKFVCIIFCKVISQQYGGFGQLRYKVCVIAIIHYQKFMHFRCLRK